MNTDFEPPAVLCLAVECIGITNFSPLQKTVVGDKGDGLGDVGDVEFLEQLATVELHRVGLVCATRQSRRSSCMARMSRAIPIPTAILEDLVSIRPIFFHPHRFSFPLFSNYHDLLIRHAQ